jgi:phage N-6-adenine-methyltransferase
MTLLANKTNFNQGVFFSIENTTEVWETPQDFYDNLDKLFHFTLDVCADPTNAKAETFFTKEEDGLSQKWTRNVWMNPPYGRVIGKWIRKAYEETQNGNVDVAVCLVPSRTCSAWWHDYCMKGEVWFIRHRLRFGGSKINAPFPNAVVIFRKGEIKHSFTTIDRHGNFVLKGESA